MRVRPAFFWLVLLFAIPAPGSAADEYLRSLEGRIAALESEADRMKTDAKGKAAPVKTPAYIVPKSKAAEAVKLRGLLQWQFGHSS